MVELKAALWVEMKVAMMVVLTVGHLASYLVVM
jgi:hypothetical protein